MNKSRILSNLLVLVSSQAASSIISFATLVFSARYLKDVRFGELALGASLAGLAGVAISLGMDSYTTRTTARGQDESSAGVSAAFVTRAILSIPVPLALGLYAHLFHLNAETTIVVYVSWGTMVFVQLGTLLVAAFQGLERMSIGATGQVSFSLVSLVLVLAVIVLHGGVIGIALTSVMASASTLGVYLWWSRRLLHLTLHISVADTRRVIGGSLAFWANSIFLTFYITADSVILSALTHGTRAVAYYNPPGRILGASLFVPTLIASATVPLLSRLGMDAGEEFIRVGRKTASLLIVCAVPLTIGMFTFAGPIIRTAFDSSFGPSVPVLMIFSLCLPFMYLNILAGTMLGARDQQMRWTVIMAASCVINPVLNLIFIPIGVRQWHNGAMGAASALLVTEILMAVYGALVLRKVTINRVVGRVTLAALVAGSAQGLVIRIVSGHWIMLGEAIGLGLYTILALLLGALPRDDATMIARRIVPTFLLPKKLRGPASGSVP